MENMRYSVRDQNGDELAAFHSWALAARALREWGGEGKVWDNYTDTVQLSTMDSDEPEWMRDEDEEDD